MTLYEKFLRKEIADWEKKMLKKSSPVDRLAKTIQGGVTQLIPAKAQAMLTDTIQKLTETIMFGSNLLSIKDDTSGMSLAERDWLVRNCFETYKKTAVVQGAGFGAGGLLLGLADFPVLLSIKIKFLFDAAKLYGYDTEDVSERLYLLYIFQLAFSGEEHRREVYDKILSWNKDGAGFPKEEFSKEVLSKEEWQKFQMEYRDYIDLAKLLQLLPIVGIAAGAAANFTLMDRLYECTANCYRMRGL